MFFFFLISLQNTVLKRKMNCSFSIYFKATLCPLLASTSVIAFLQNVVFCAIVWHDKTLHKRSLILIVSLSASGIFNALTVPVFEFIYVYYFPAWPLGSLGTNLQNSIWLFSLVLPFMTVTCILTLYDNVILEIFILLQTKINLC